MCNDSLEELLAVGLATKAGKDYDLIGGEEREKLRLQACTLLETYNGHNQGE